MSMKDAATWLLVTEVADSTALRSSARRTERAGARREFCMLNDRSSAKVGLEGVRERTDPRTQGQEAAPLGLKAGSPIANATWHAAMEVCCDPEPILTDLLSQQMSRTSRFVSSYRGSRPSLSACTARHSMCIHNKSGVKTEGGKGNMKRRSKNTGTEVKNKRRV